MPLKITLVTEENIAAISAISLIAVPIWHQHYDPIIGSQQVDYMLEKFQSVSAIENQIKEGYEYYQIRSNEQLVGYISIQVRDATDLFISKFYLLEETRGKGFGRHTLTFIEQKANQAGCLSLKLTVNKENPAYQIYLKLGFVNYASAQFDIGEGYIMDDFLMEKKL